MPSSGSPVTSEWEPGADLDRLICRAYDDAMTWGRLLVGWKIFGVAHLAPPLQSSEASSLGRTSIESVGANHTQHIASIPRSKLLRLPFDNYTARGSESIPQPQGIASDVFVSAISCPAGSTTQVSHSLNRSGIEMGIRMFCTQSNMYIALNASVAYSGFTVAYGVTNSWKLTRVRPNLTTAFVGSLQYGSVNAEMSAISNANVGTTTAVAGGAQPTTMVAPVTSFQNLRSYDQYTGSTVAFGGNDGCIVFAKPTMSGRWNGPTTWKSGVNTNTVGPNSC